MLRDILNKGVQTITPQEKEMIANKHVSINVVEQGASKRVIVSILVVVLILSIGIFLLWLWNHQLKRRVRIEMNKSAEMQNKLFQMYKEAEVGKVVAQISHQWRGPLTKIGAINTLMYMKLKTGTELIESQVLMQDVKAIEEIVEFMSQTMEDFLEFYKPQKDKEKFSVYATVLQAQHIVAESIASIGVNVHVECLYEYVLFGIKNQWIHVWLNLFDNSIKAFRSNNIASPSIHIRIDNREIKFTDNAGGMPEKTAYSLQRGLGLQICAEIVEGHNGVFSYANTDNGTEFTITLKDV